MIVAKSWLTVDQESKDDLCGAQMSRVIALMMLISVTTFHFFIAYDNCTRNKSKIVVLKLRLSLLFSLLLLQWLECPNASQFNNLKKYKERNVQIT